VTAAKGFRAAGVSAGLKRPGMRDLALVVNDGPSNAAAGVFTRNRVQAAPVLWSREAVSDGRLAAVVLNSGGANACTGPDGFADTHATAEKAAGLLDVSAADVAVCSTGLIGVRLPIDNLLAGLDTAAAALGGDGSHGADAAEAIMTTDTVAKEAAVAGAGWTVGGTAKGAGMLAPALATMLVVLTTDADLDAATLDTALRAASAHTFERVDADGCLSTNDTVLLLASGASGVRPEPAAFAAALTACCADLARQLVADAEGAEHEVEIAVTGAASEADALEVARAVARNNLVKTAIFGKDPNWGRILGAVGTTAAAFQPDLLDVAVNGVKVCLGGAAGEDRSLVDLSGRHVLIEIALHAGPATAIVWTTDLTHAYVHENSAYST
jgi:glutamate N-acetyltransferase/amino-acid N-acetyltransferase